MDTGLSLFSEGVDNVPVNTADQGEEGDDYLEEHNRKREELGAELRDAFEDLSEHSEDDSFNSSGQSDNDESPHVPPSDYYSYDRAPLSRVPSDKFSYQNGSDGHAKARYLMFNGDHSAVPNGSGGRLFTHQVSSNECSPTEENRERITHHHPGYYDSGHINGSTHSPTDDSQYRQADLGSQEQLMIMYRARVLEVKRLTDDIESLRREKDSEIDALKRQVLAMETEKQAAVISQKESHHLLANREVQINSLQQELEKLETLNINLEKDKCELSEEVNLLKSSATDLQHKVTLLERNGNTIVPSEKQMESFYKTMQQRHESEMRDLQSQLGSIMNKLKTKEGECVILEERIRNLTRAHHDLQVDKAETVNKMATQLDEAQRKMQSLASNSAVHEMTKLQVMLEQIEKDKKTLEEKLALTTEKLELAERDLIQYESATRLGLFNGDDSSQETDSITHLGISRRHSDDKFDKQDKFDKSRDSNHSKRSSADQEDLTAKLQTELHRALQGQHSKRAEIRRLQEQLTAKEKKIKDMLEKEQIYVMESKKYKADLTGVLDRLKRQEEDLKYAYSNESRLKARCVELQKELEEAKDLVEKFQALEKENASLREKIRVAQQEEKEKTLELENYNEALKRAREEIPPSVEKELTDLRVRLEQSQKECKEMKQLYTQVNAEKRVLITRFEEKELRLAIELKSIKTQRDEFEAQYQESQQIIKNLEVEQSRLQKSLDEALRASSSVDKNTVAIEKVIEEGERKCRQLQDRITFLENENRRTSDLEAECSRLREELSVISNRHQIELERISRERSHSRERVVQLERKLREEFQAQIDPMTAEIDSLRKQIDQKDQVLDEYMQTLNRIKPSTKDAAIETVSDEGLQKKVVALATQLEKAEERHRNVVETLRQEFDRRLAAQEKEMRSSQETQLALIGARYKVTLSSSIVKTLQLRKELEIIEREMRLCRSLLADENVENVVLDDDTEIATIEDQVKEDAAKYFAEEVSAVQEKYIQEHNAVMKRMRENEAKLSIHIESLKESLQERVKEVEELKRIGSGNCEEIKRLHQQIDSERNKVAEMVSCWSAEMQDRQNEIAKLSNELNEVRAERTKLKKAALHYKKQVDQVRQGQKDTQRKEMIGQDYREALFRVKARAEEAVNKLDQERRRSLDSVLYENQLLDMAAKQRNLNL